MTDESWAARIAGFRAADKQERERAEAADRDDTMRVPFHMVSFLETLAAQQAEQTMLLQEILAALRARNH